MPQTKSSSEDRVVWKAQAGPQEALLACPIPLVFYGGARGGGKTDGLIGDFVAHAGRYGKDAKGILLRRSYPEFTEIKKRCNEILTALGWQLHKKDLEWEAPNGATLILRYLESDSDADNYQGHQYTWIGVDEVGNFSSLAPIWKMFGTLRSPKGVPVSMRLTGNPGGVGHIELKETFIDPSPPFTPFEVKPQEESDETITAVFIPATLEDNPLLTANDPGYESRLALVGGPDLFRAWRFGDWDAVAGAAFGEWRQDLHVTTMDPPDTWGLIGGGDWGYAKPGCVHVAGVGPDGEILVCWEFVFNGKGMPKMGAWDAGFKCGSAMGASVQKGSLHAFPEFISFDAAAWASGDGRGGKWKSIAELFQQGMSKALGDKCPPLIASPKGPNSRRTGKVLFHQLLSFKKDREGKIPPWYMPRLRFNDRCRYAINTIPALPKDPKNPEDVDTNAPDHAYDSIRYLLAARTPEVYMAAKRAPGFDRHPGMGERSKKPWVKSLLRKTGADRHPGAGGFNKLPTDLDRNDDEMAVGW